ncbi:prepilin-type N-terminal cleavage/methylation domain-containing protein [Photobacterium sp. BZF1]|uniref:type II secretion system protein n=1 Tax=Photobacterium sp. BZF1 TaxID=1904457 RepID=UPI0016539844|nr:type II secretion system protein [Photobacterium sp. BZF1]MBC7004356.1 prepilin-type N-terminal cleavage/methylation domain-containing protein [Photobacterium sp. BZF1]
MNNKGFTLVEMVVAIVLLGIIAVTAAPRILSTPRDARIATLDGFIGGFEAANSIVISKAMTAGVEHSITPTLIPGTNITVVQNQMDLDVSNVAESMNVDGFNLFQLKLDPSKGTGFAVYLGEEKAPSEIRRHECKIVIWRFKDNDKNGFVLGDTQVIKQYDGC